MLDVSPVEAAVVRCLAAPSALDDVTSPVGTFACRLAPSDMMLVAEPSTQPTLVSHLEDYFATADAYALTLEQRDAWSIWKLSGDAHRRAFARLSPIQLPASTAFFQGGVAHIPAKVLACSDAIYIMVASTLGHHLRARLVAGCADLSPTEGSLTSFTSRHAGADTVR